jgi:hypothetical protein
MEYFDRLGAALERAWSARERDEDVFPDLALEALAALPPKDHLDVDALIDGVLDPFCTAPRQLAPLGAFGQPGVTTHYGRGFVVDVYFWTHSQSAIHDHPFRGAFVIVKGESVHARYRWVEHERLGPRARLGELTLAALELAGEGTVERFGMPQDPLVHALIHVPSPSVSMVVRTIRTHSYFRYFPPSIAIAMDEPDDVVGRPLAMLDMLRASGDARYAERLARFLSHADFETTFRALSRVWSAAGEEERARLIAIVSDRHGSRADHIANALSRALRAHGADAIRAQVSDADDRLVATGLMLAETRAQLFELLGRRHDPIPRLHTFFDATFDQPELAVVARALSDGLGEDGALARLRENFGEDSVDEAALRAYCRTSMLAVLTR